MFQPLRRYAQFRGRATRTEYWQWMLFQFALFGVLGAWAGSRLPAAEYDAGGLGLEYDPAYFINGPALLLAAASLAFVIPNIAVAVRRLHDSDRSGWWLLLNLLPTIGQFVLFIFFVSDGNLGPNRHGQDPRGRALGR